MSRKSLNEMLRYLRPLTRYEAIAIHEFQVPKAVHNKWPAFDEFKKILVGRFKATPCSDRSTSNITLLERLQSLGALDSILSRSVIEEEIQSILEVFEIDEQLRLLGDDHRSSHNFPSEFHRSVLRVIYGQILQLNKLSKQYEVEKEWFSDYVSASHKQMIREVRALFPLYPFGGPKGHLTSRAESAEGLLSGIFAILDNVLQAHIGRGRKELAIQLTAVFCSRSKFFSSGFTHEAVRSKLFRRKRSRSQRSA